LTKHHYVAHDHMLVETNDTIVLQHGLLFKGDFVL
jgi:hypothetical protein